MGHFFSDPISRTIFRHGNYINIGGDNFILSIWFMRFPSSRK